jgi:hypothetical protein
LMAYLGLVPSEHSSGRTVHRAGITKAGNALARRALIEGAWTYRMQARVSRKLHDRIDGLPQIVRDIAWKAQVRHCARYRRLAAAGKPKVVVTTASPARCSGSSGRSLKPSRPLGRFNVRSNNAHGCRRGAVRESSRPTMSRLCRRSPFRPRQPKTKPRSCGNQPAHESLLNRRLRPRLLPCAF